MIMMLINKKKQNKIRNKIEENNNMMKMTQCDIISLYIHDLCKNGDLNAWRDDCYRLATHSPNQMPLPHLFEIHDCKVKIHVSKLTWEICFRSRKINCIC